MDTTNSSEKPQRRVKHGQRPTEPLADWPAEFGAAGAEQPAATSGDAPTDLQQLKALALAAGGVEFHTALGDRAVRYDGFAGSYFTPSKELSRFIVAANPAVVLGLIARIEHLTTVPEQAPSTEQEWAKVDPAVAFHLIERHAEDWADAGRMMLAWRDANPAPATASGDELPSKITDGDSARSFVAEWHRKNFPTDRTFTNYIMGRDRHCALAGDFAWQLAKALESMEARAAVSAATKPTADLSTLAVYEFSAFDNGDRQQYVKLADVQSLLTTKPAAAPEGWKLVPVDPSIAMCIHGADKMSGNDGREAAAVYRAMIHAAPAASTTGAAQTAEQVPQKTQQPEKCWSRDEEDFSHQSLEDLLDTHDELNPGDTVWVADAVRPNMNRLIDADDVTQTMGERAYDIAGEYAEDYPDVSKEAKDELNVLLAGWISKNCAPTFWGVENVRAYVLSAGDFPIPTHSSEAGDADQA